MIYELSRVVLPTIKYLNNTNLFFNKTTSVCEINNILKELYVYKFNTWMNIFPAKKYHTYSVIDNLFLQIRVDNNVEIQIYGFNYNEAIYNEDLIYQGKLEANVEHKIPINNFEKYENIYFSIISDEKELNIQQAAWVTRTEPIRDNKLAIITCTFKREEYIYRNIDLFNTFLNKNPQFKDKIKLYVVDNGKTLISDIENDSVKVFPNKNAGGAGGFTRGIIEAKNSGENFTRILLMDDDVEVFPEAFYRTLILSNYLKDEYENAFIHGAMLNMYRKNMFFESTAIQNDYWCYSYHGELDIAKSKNIAAINYTPSSLFDNKSRKVSSAWWYCCFSMQLVKEKGLPLPVFFRCDDLEWSWRNFGEHHITMSGISVWHAPFEWRVSKPVEHYFSKRNIIMINMLHTDGYKKIMLKMLKKDFRHLIKTCDYTSCAIYLKMMNDLLLGSKTYKQDPEILLKTIFEYVKADNVSEIKEQKAAKNLIQKYKKYKLQKKYYRRLVYVLKSTLWIITMQAKLVPTSLWKTQKNIWSSAPIEEFLFCKELKLYNLATNKVETRCYDSTKRKNLENEFNKTFKKLDKKYEIIRNDFKQSFKEFITEEFWKEYLELN